MNNGFANFNLISIGCASSTLNICFKAHCVVVLTRQRRIAGIFTLLIMHIYYIFENLNKTFSRFYRRFSWCILSQNRAHDSARKNIHLSHPLSYLIYKSMNTVYQNIKTSSLIVSAYLFLTNYPGI